MKSLVLVAVAAMGLTACQNDIEEQIEAKESVTVEFIADSAESRTSVDTEGDVPVFSWDSDETFAVLEQTATTFAQATEVEFAKDDDGKATITATFDHNAGYSEYKYVAVYPESKYMESESINAVNLYLSVNQTMYSTTSYDPNADLMVSRVVTTAAQPTEAQYLQFTRLAAVAKMAIKGVEEGDAIERVVFSAEDKTIAGTISVDLENVAKEDGTHTFTVVEGSDSVSVDGEVNDGTVYFTTLPFTLEAGDSYTITVVTENKIYRKEGSVAEGKSIPFEAGNVTRLGVDLSTATAGDKWVLVKDVNELEAGDIVTFVSKDYNYALGAKYYTNYNKTSGYPYASYTEVVKIGDYIYHPTTPEGTSAGDKVIQQLVVVQRDNTKSAFDFYNGVDYDSTKDTQLGYMSNYSTNNYLYPQEYPTNNSLFYTTIAEDGTATLEATDSEYKYKALKYYEYSSTSSTGHRFVCTNSTTAAFSDICIYKIAGGVKGVVPTPDAQFTVPDEDEPVVVVKEGVVTATEISEVVFSYVGDWTISVSDDADWFTVSYADEKLTYTATANTGSVRTATVTITASHDGEEDIVKTFKVVQKGEPQVISVKEFSALPVDENSEYIVTGILTTIPTSNNSNLVVSDAAGNTANFRYVYMADNTSTLLYNNDDIKVGDVVTILATKSNSSYGGSISAHALCQGYYNLSATAAADHVAYGGGDVKVTIAKNGTLTPQTITGSVSADFATLTYTENATEATVKLAANDGAPRDVVVTFTDGYATTSVTIIQGADTTKGNTWELVTDASTLETGDKVIIAAKDYDVAMSTTINSSDRRAEAAVTKLGNYYIIPAALDVQTFVLGAGSVDGTFAFYDDTNKGFLVSSSTSSSSSVSKLENQAYVDDEASFQVTIADGAATIKNVAGEFSGNYISYNTGKYFISSTSTGSPLSLYRLVGAKGTIPVVAADVTANDAVISDAAATEPTAIPEVVFNYVGDWTITATSEAEWLTSLAFDKEQNCLTYTAEANNSAARETAVTITASLLGQTPITWTFGLLQKGYIPTKTIAEYLAIPVDERSDNIYVRYKMTGRIESIESTSATSCKFTITDGTDSVQVYGLETEDGSQDYGDFGLKVGDVVTLTAPRLTEVETAGKGSNNPAYYISHYNISATATAAEYEAGSTATISVATTSGLDVAYEMADCDFAEISYTTDPTSENTTATVTFTSENTADVARSVDVTFRTGLASTTITVTQKIDPSKVKGWTLVTDASTLVIGDKITIVAKNADKAIACPTSKTVTTYSAVTITKQGTVISDVEEAGVLVFTVVDDGDENDATVALEFTFSDDTTRYLCATSATGLRSRESINDSARITITIDESSKAAIASPNKQVYFNSATGTAFSANTSTNTNVTKTENLVCIYKYYAE